MPAFAHVSYNSARIQRAYRINNIETMKLQHSVQLLEKERMHRQRLTNQDIRLISLTLDYIQTSSGHSQEGLAPDEEPGQKLEQDEGPCFLYGERIVSRKKRRTIRPQSALDKGSLRTNSETASTISGSDFTPRPQSSPARHHNSTFVTHIRDRDDQSQYGSESEYSKSGASTPRFKPAWINAPASDVTKILLRANNNNQKRRTSIFDSSQERDDPSQTMSRNMRIRSQSAANKLNSMSASDDRPFQSGRGTRITDLLNKDKSAMTAAEWKSHLNRAQSAGPVTSSLQRKSILESKKAWNNSRTGAIQTKVKKFLSEES